MLLDCPPSRAKTRTMTGSSGTTSTLPVTHETKYRPTGTIRVVMLVQDDVPMSTCVTTSDASPRCTSMSTTVPPDETPPVGLMERTTGAATYVNLLLPVDVVLPDSRVKTVMATSPGDAAVPYSKAVSHRQRLRSAAAAAHRCAREDAGLIHERDWSAGHIADVNANDILVGQGEIVAGDRKARAAALWPPPWLHVCNDPRCPKWFRARAFAMSRMHTRESPKATHHAQHRTAAARPARHRAPAPASLVDPWRRRELTAADRVKPTIRRESELKSAIIR